MSDPSQQRLASRTRGASSRARSTFKSGLVLGGIAACAVATALPASASAKSKGTIAGVTFAAQDAGIYSEACGEQSEAKKLGYSFHWYASATVDVPTEVTNFQAAVTNKSAGIVLTGFSATAFQSGVNTAMSNGEPVVSLFAPLSPNNAYKTVEEAGGASNSVGVDLAKVAVPDLKSGDAVVAMGDQAGTSLVSQRVNEFINKVKSVKGVQILPNQYANASSSKTALVLTELLSSHPNLKVVYAGDTSTMTGILSALAAAHNTSVKVVGMGNTVQEIDDLKAGKNVIGLGAEPNAELGAESVEQIVNWLKAHPNGGKVPATKGQLTAPIVILTKKNASSAQAKSYTLYQSPPPSCKTGN